MMKKTVADIKTARYHYAVFLGILIYGFLVIPLILITVFTTIKSQPVPQAAEETTCQKPPEFGQKPDKERAIKASQLLSDKTKELKTKQGPELVKTLEERKNCLVEAMYRDSDKALSSVLSLDEINNLKTIAPTLIEQPTEIEGSLEVIHADFFEDQVSDTRYSLITNDGKKFNIHLSSAIYQPLESRTKVKIKGLQLDNNILFDASRPIQDDTDGKGGLDVLSQPGNPPVLGEQKTVVLLINFQNTPQPSLTKAEEETFLTDKLAPYYAENSYNKISINGVARPIGGDVYGWYTIPVDQSCTFTIQNEAMSVADSDVNFTDYNRLIIVAPFGPGCSYAGMATFGSRILSTPDGTTTMSISYIVGGGGDSLWLVGHELGHNFGNDHASFIDCGDVSITSDLSNCTYYEYDDSYDIMGWFNTFHFNARHKEVVGWFDTSNIQTVTTDGTYVIEPIETATSGLKALKIQRSINGYLYLEYRQPLGYDQGAPASAGVYQGVLVHLASSSTRSYLVNPDPMDGEDYITILPGRTLTDPATTTQISVISATATSLTVYIDIGKSDFIRPTATVTSPVTGSTVSGTTPVRVSAFDESGIEQVEAYYARQPAGIKQFIGADTTEPFSINWDTSLVLDGLYDVQAYAYDLSGTPFGVANNVGYSTYVSVNLLNHDSDGDGVGDDGDNCPSIVNPLQENTDNSAFDNGPGITGGGVSNNDDTTVPNGDGQGDACDSDDDNDGLADSDEVTLANCGNFNGLAANHPNPERGDRSNDDNGNGNPAAPMGTDAADNGPSHDTDGDGVLDGYECQRGTNPRDRLSSPAALVDDGQDTDGDGLLNGWERRGWGTNPNVVDSDGDGLGDCKEAADLNGDRMVLSPSDGIWAIRAALDASFGKTLDFDINKDGVALFPTDAIEIYKRAVGSAVCL